MSTDSRSWFHGASRRQWLAGLLVLGLSAAFPALADETVDGLSNIKQKGRLRVAVLQQFSAVFV